MKKSALLCVIGAGISWGTSGLFMYWLNPYGFDSLQVTAVRGVTSFLCMLLYIVCGNIRLLRAKPTDLLMYLGSGAALFGTSAFYYMSMQASSIATGVVLMYTAPVYVMIVSVLFFGEKLSRLKVFAVGCMLVGCCLVAGVFGGAEINTTGVFFGILSGISYAAYNLFTKWELRRGCSSATASLYNFLVVAIIGLCISDPAVLVEYASVKPSATVPLLLGVGIMTCFVPYILYSTALQSLPAGTAAALAIVEPMSATLFGLLLGESLTVLSTVGVVLILLSVLLLNRAERVMAKSVSQSASAEEIDTKNKEMLV